MEEEIASQEANNTWEVVDRPEGYKLLDTRWVFKIKQNPDGTVDRYKARLVIRGYRQQEGVDYYETFAPVCRYESIRLLLNLAAANRMRIVQFDVKTAFLHGTLRENIFTKIPEGYPVQGSGQVLRLIKSIYGLKQAPRCWSEKFTKFLYETFHMEKSQYDPSGYAASSFVVLALYVDDGLIISPDYRAIQRILEEMKGVFEITEGPPTRYVGLEISQESGIIGISQCHFIKTLLEKFNMENCSSTSVPMQPYEDLVPAKESNEKLPYRQLIGALLFLAKCSRPDISFAVSKLSQFVTCYDETHWKAAKTILRYLKGTSHLGISYHPGMKSPLKGFSDSDYAGDKNHRRSTSGVVVMLNDSIISWTSQKQSCVALSTTEAEYVAASAAAREIIGLRNFMEELGFPQREPTCLWIDNQSAIRLVKNPEMHPKTKHIDVRFHYIREQVEEGEIIVDYIPSEEQRADILTKCLLKGKLETNRDRLGISPVTRTRALYNRVTFPKTLMMLSLR